MNKLKAITDIYNDRQDEFEIIRSVMHGNGLKLEIYYKFGRVKGLRSSMGFYEWLGNPQYKVVEILNIVVGNLFVYKPYPYVKSFKPVEEIIDYLYEAVK